MISIFLEVIVTVERRCWEEGSCHSSELTPKIVATDTLLSGMPVRESKVTNSVTTKDDTNIIPHGFVQRGPGEGSKLDGSREGSNDEEKPTWPGVILVCSCRPSLKVSIMG
jgi:hypothetical protein